jgi:signal transduction histidine kinase
VIAFNAARLVQERVSDQRTIEARLHAILRSVQRAERLLQDLLDDLQDEPRTFDVKPLVVSAARLLDEAGAAGEPIASRGSASLTVAGTCDRPVLADCERITQVFGNLIENAAKYSPPGGRITLRAVSVEEEVHFSVADDGPGIKEQDRARAFEPLWRANPDQPGRGLGLCICKQIIESHGGRIWIENPGTGTTVVFALPCAAAGTNPNLDP